jgi:hypothetical protein
MSKPFAPRATALVLAIIVTASLLASLDSLAVSEHSGAQYAAACAAQQIVAAKNLPASRS